MRDSRKATFGVTAGVLVGLVSGFVWADTSHARCECEKRMEAKLERDFSFYTDPETVLEFDFAVGKQANHVEVQLYGLNFDGDDTEWTQKVEPAFKDFIGSIGETVSYEMEKPMVRMHVVGVDGSEVAVFRFE